MGLQLCIPVGSDQHNKMIKVLVSLFFATVASASPWGYGYPYHHGHGYHAPGLVQHHAGGGHSFQSGSHLGKRSAEPHGFFPLYHYGYHHVHHPGSATLEDGELSVTHPGGGTSTVSGHSLGKRSASPHGYYGYYPFHHGFYGHHLAAPVKALAEPGTAVHPGGATSYVARSAQGAGRKRREADAEPIVWGLRNGHGGFVGQAIPAHHHGFY